MRLLPALLILLAWPAMAAGVSVEKAEALMDEARACAKAGDGRCVLERMGTVLRSDEALEALSAQQGAVISYWLYYYRTGLDVVGAAEPAEKIRLAAEVIDLIEARFPEQANAAMPFHLMKAEAHAAIGDLAGGAEDARQALKAIETLAGMNDDEAALFSVSEAKARLAALETLYKGAL